MVNPQGIATDGTDIWIVDAASDTVSRFAGAAQFTSGVAPSTDSFRIQPDNQDPSGLATDGQKLWITDDMARSRCSSMRQRASMWAAGALIQPTPVLPVSPMIRRAKATIFGLSIGRI